MGIAAYTPKLLSASGMVKGDQGKVKGFVVASGTPEVTVYDGTDNTGNVIFGPVTVAAGQAYPLGPAHFNVGLYVALNGAGNLTVFFE